MRRSISEVIVRKARAMLGATAATIVALAIARPGVAHAQGTAPDAGSCQPALRELDTCRRSAEERRREAATAEHEAAECKHDLESTSTELQQSVDATKACQQDRDRTRGATAAFVDELLRGHSLGGRDSGCISAEQQARLDAFVHASSNASTWLGQLNAYGSGESDAFPRARPGATPLDRALQRLGTNGSGIAVYRRLLVEALKIVTPRAWERIRIGGTSSIEAWFASAAPLDADLIAEAQHASTGNPGLAGPPLTAALHLVRAFQLAASCGPAPLDSRECGRARQLQQMLESTGSLVVRRRIQEIWATDCAAISTEAIMPWIEDFPSARFGDVGEPWTEIAVSAHAKLFACYLDDSTNHVPYGTWLKDTLPSPRSLNATRLQRVDAILSQWDETSREAACARAVRAMQTFVVPPTCAVPLGDFRDALVAWKDAGAKRDDANVALGTCAQFAQLLWEGKAASIDGSFAHPPSLDEMVVARDAPPTPTWRLRSHCDERRGAATFPAEVVTLASFARSFGEGVDRPPFRVDPVSSKPAELVRFEASRGAQPWFSHVARGVSACSVLGLDDARCKKCSEATSTALYDCSLVAELDAEWTRRTRGLFAAIGLVLAVVIAATWFRRIVHARRSFVGWGRETAAFFDAIGLTCRPDRWRLVWPSRHDTLRIALPSDPAWQRWGTMAAIVRAPPRRVLERDVNHAAFVARRLGVSVVLLEHEDDVSPDLSAVRAMLEWAGKGGARAVQILPIGVARVRWSKSAQDVLDIVEESSLRGNPFDVRGRIATSTQFFDRERLVSGLLAAAQAGHWIVVTGLRRFGKSSLVLEIARRLPGPSAYVDLAGFDHELSGAGDPSSAADQILRFVCLRLVESSRAWWPAARLPPAPTADTPLDAAALILWFRELQATCREASGQPVPTLVVIDEIEQALSGGPQRLGHALEVLAIVIGRLKSAVGDMALPDGGAPIGVFLTSALHPLLWAPLRTLAHQSIMGSLQRVCVPCLDEEAASTMMRSLGARQGVRFKDEALSRIVTESQGVPILLRRLGSSILELYDAQRARQGSLGAVEVGAVGAEEAIDREAGEGAPLRVWVETEIAGRNTVPGLLLRKLARSESVSTSALTTLAKGHIEQEFVRTGVADKLPPEELERRAEEAAHVIIQLLDESGLLVPHGDLTAPAAYALPEGVIRRVLSAARPTIKPRVAGEVESDDEGT
jgi:hypothetical protein